MHALIDGLSLKSYYDIRGVRYLSDDACELVSIERNSKTFKNSVPLFQFLIENSCPLYLD